MPKIAVVRTFRTVGRTGLKEPEELDLGAVSYMRFVQSPVSRQTSPGMRAGESEYGLYKLCTLVSYEYDNFFTTKEK